MRKYHSSQLRQYNYLIQHNLIPELLHEIAFVFTNKLGLIIDKERVSYNDNDRYVKDNDRGCNDP